jgi:D-3-phosphoglycerate dehydrogenase / 2-oxoglutarate reductase
MAELIVLVTDHTWPSTEVEARVLAEVGAHLIEAPTGNEAELITLVPQADAILTCFAKVTAEVIRAGHRLQVIGRYGIGVDNIAVEQATRLGIPVTNVPAYCLDEVAEHALALVLACARRIVPYDGAVHRGDWRLETGMPMFRVRGRILGIVGFGKIGQTVARKAVALGLQRIAFDPYVADAVFREHGVEATSLEELLARSDFVTLHVPLTAETRHMFDAERLTRLKPTAFLINTSRGGVIDQDALVAALQRGRLAGAALDVFEPERLADGHPLLALSNVIGTPHVAFYSEESVRELALLGARNVAAILAGRRPASLVNPEVLALSRWAHLEPALAPSARSG